MGQGDFREAYMKHPIFVAGIARWARHYRRHRTSTRARPTKADLDDLRKPHPLFSQRRHLIGDLFL
jgi:hypothetical protein